MTAPVRRRPGLGRLVDVDLGVTAGTGYRDPSRQVPAPTDRDLAGWLRSVRAQAGAWQSEVAMLLGVRQSAVSAWERGVNRPPSRTVACWPELCAQAAELAQARAGAR